MVASIVYHLTNMATASVKCLGQGPNGGPCDTGLPQVSLESDTLHTVLQFAFGVIGALALITVLIAAIKYVTSSGDPQAVKEAHNTLIYAAIGLLVALLAEAIVTFVLTNV